MWAISEHVLYRCGNCRRSRMDRKVVSGSHQLDGGFTLVEMLISMLVMALVVSMTLVIITNVLTGTVSSTRLGVSAANVELGASEVAQYIRSTITPSEAASLPDSTSSCSHSTAVISANPFFVEFCGKSPVSGSAYNDYVLDTTSCTKGKAYPYCDLTLLDTSTTPWSDVWSMANVWCDSQCQDDVKNFFTPPWRIGNTPAMFKYCMVSPQSTSGPPEVKGCTSNTSNTSGTSVSGFSCTVNGSSASGLACIGAIQISVTVLANPQATQSATPTKPPLGSTVTQTIILTNVISQFGS